VARLALLVPVTAFAQSVSVSVDAAKSIRTVDERVFGVNAVTWDAHAGTAQTISMMQDAGVRTIRAPGGSLSDTYRWDANRSFDYTWSWAAGFDAFTRLIMGLNAQAFVTVNYGNGTPEQAAAWVAYANASATLLGSANDVSLGTDAKNVDWKTAGYWSALRAAGALATDDGRNFLRLSRNAAIGVKYWEIGNECYGSWENDEQSVPHDPYTYAVRAKAYIAKMKAVDPTIKVGVVVVMGEDAYANNTSHPATNPRTGAVHNGWTPVMLATLKSLGVTPDFIIDHRYEQAPGQETDAALLQSAATWPAEIASLRQQLNDYLGTDAAKNVEIVVTENNSVYTDPGKQSTSLVNGLFLADSLGQVMQTEVNAFMWWALRNGPPMNNGQIAGNMNASLYGWRNYGDYGILSSQTNGGAATYYEAYPTYYVLKLLAKFARGGDTIVSATSGNSLLSVYAAKRADGTLALLVLNKDRSASQSANIALSGFTPAATATSYTYGIAQDDAAKPGGTGSKDLAATNPSISGTTFSASFAPYSATVLVLTASSGNSGGSSGGTTTPTTPSSSGGGGGGGAPSVWAVVAVVMAVSARRLRVHP
jgi:hypothetical protein